MPKERIRKLAKHLNLSAEDVIRALEALGYEKYRHPSDMLPEAVVAEVQAELKRRGPRQTVPATGSGRGEPARRVSFEIPRAFPDEPALTAALEEYLSANPLAGKRQRTGTIGKQKDERRDPPVSSVALDVPESTEALLRDSLGAEIRQRRQLSEALEQATAELVRSRTEAGRREAVLREQLRAVEGRLAEQEQVFLVERKRLERALSDLEASLGERVGLLERELRDTAASEREQREALETATRTEERLRHDLETLRVRLAEEVVARQVAQGRMERLERKLKEARARESARAPIPRPSPPQPSVPAAPERGAVPLDEVFEQRGLQGPHEVRTALGVLLRDGFYHDTMELLATFSPAALARALERRISLVCDNCDPPEERYPIRVEDDKRCEVCQGHGLADAASTFVEACRDRSIQRVNLVGGPPRARQRVVDLLANKVDIRLLEQPLTIPDDWLREMAERADLTILWGDTFLDHRVTSQFRRLEGVNVVHVAHHGAGGMLRAASRAIADLKPAASLFSRDR